MVILLNYCGEGELNLSGQRGHILVVDDNEMNRLKLSMGLKKQGHTVLQAEGGQRALEMLRAEPFDLLLLDILMPGIDGYQVLREMKGDELLRDIPVIVISALNEMDSIVTAIELGAEDYLPKTFDPVLLKARIGACLEKKRLRDNEQLYLKGLERELEIGRQIQAGFLPEKLPQPPGWEIAARLQPARQVAGDFYDAFVTGHDNKIGLVIGDVCNKGVGAALFMTLFRSLIRAIANFEHFTRKNLRLMEFNDFTGESDRAIISDEINLKHTVQLTNDYIAITHSQAHMFSTLFFGLLDSNTGSLVYINGGNEPPIIVGPNGIKSKLLRTGPVVGLFPGIDYQVASAHLEPGDILFAFTDGVTDAQNPEGELFSQERLITLLDSPVGSTPALLNKIETALQAHAASADQYDDITMLAVRRIP